jgi:serine/threonine-protein kinase
MKHVQERAVPPRQIVPSIPPGLEQVVLRAMEKDPARRYRNADEMGIDLDRVRKGLEPALAPLPPEHPASRTMVAPAAVPIARDRQPTQPARRAAWPWIVALLLVAVVAAASAYFLTGLGDRGGTTQPTTTAATAPVPRLVGLQVAPAQALLQQLRFTNVPTPIEVASDRPVGEVVSQDPPEATPAALDAPIQLTVSSGPQMIDLPLVEGKTIEIAIGLLGDFKVHRVDKPDPTVATGNVISQDPTSAQAPKGSVVTLTVSSGPAPVAVPNVVNKQEGDARSILSGVGLVVRFPSLTAPSSTIPAGTVISVSPNVGRLVRPGTKVTITVSSGPPDVTVPPLVDLTEADARAALKKVHLLANVTYVTTVDQTQWGQVISSDPASGDTVAAGSTVNLTVGQQ